MLKAVRLSALFFVAFSFLLPSAWAARPEGARELVIRDGWMIQSSRRVPERGEVLSSAAYNPRNWYPAVVPTTVLAALVNDKVYQDPYFGTNLRSIPSATDSGDRSFEVPWWYRTTFKIPASFRNKQIWLHFGGINYRASIWFNGHKIAGPEQVQGMWRTYDFNVTTGAQPGKSITLAVQISPPHANDLGISWLDWNPGPPDGDMGLWQPVYLTATGPVALWNPQVVTKLDLPNSEVAHLTVRTSLQNASDRTVRGVLKGKIGEVEFQQAVELKAHEWRDLTFEPTHFSQLVFHNPRLWWPWQMGPQNLYHMKLQFESGGEVSDSHEVQFGIRQITSKLNAQGYREFIVNGQPILILGAGWAPDMMLRFDPQKTEEEIQYVKDMHLNTIRLEGKIVDEHFFDLCDKYGILVLAGWCCCDRWEKWQDWKATDYTVAVDSLRDQIRRLRNHPCMLDWLYGSDNPPPPRVERAYLRTLAENHWPNPHQSSASQQVTTLTGPTGFKMTGPYNWVPPNYWLLDTQHGGAFGFNTETSPGPAVPPVSTLKMMLPEDHLWPIDSVWTFHAGGGMFQKLDVFSNALDARYGQATSVEDYAEKSQLMTYEGERAMFESFRRNEFVATGVIQWMLNNAWPSLIWHLYDYYLRPAGGYFGTKKACEPLHVQYSYDDHSVVVVNSLLDAYPNVGVRAEVYDINLKEKFSKQETVNIAPNSSTRIFAVPRLDGLSTTHFLRLSVRNSMGKLESTNFYWLSTKPDTVDWEHSTWYLTPTITYADFTGLATLPKVRVDTHATTHRDGVRTVTNVTVRNPSSDLAFFIHLRVQQDEHGPEILPVLWQDNYFELMPGEEREITASYSNDDLRGATPWVAIDGWNVVAASMPAGK